jgi:hypothetical protein
MREGRRRTYPLLGPLEVTGADGRSLVAGSLDGSLVDECLKVGTCGKRRKVSRPVVRISISSPDLACPWKLTREANRAASDGRNVDLQLVVANVAHVVLKNLHATANVGEGYNDVAVEATGTNEGLVERFGEVGGW